MILFRQGDKILKMAETDRRTVRWITVSLAWIFPRAIPLISLRFSPRTLPLCASFYQHA